MKKYKTIDDFIERIVMRFDYNGVTEKIIHKLNTINEYNNFTIDNDSIRNEYSNRVGERTLNVIKVDTDNNKIISYIEGDKKGKNYQKAFVHNLEYSEKGNIKTTFNYSKNQDIEILKNGKKSDKTTLKNTYHYYDNESLVGISVEEKSTEYLFDENDLIITKKESFNSEVSYALVTGDRIKMKNNNGEIEYLYYSKNQKDDDAFSRIITREEFDNLVIKSADAYKLINDDLVFKSHKGLF